MSVVKHGSGINALAFDSDTDILYTAGDNNTIKAWNVTVRFHSIACANSRSQDFVWQSTLDTRESCPA